MRHGSTNVNGGKYTQVLPDQATRPAGQKHGREDDER